MRGEREPAVLGPCDFESGSDEPRVKHWYTTFLTNGLLLACGLVSSVLLARVLGPDDRGLLAAIIFWPHLVVGIVALGLNESTVVQIAARGERPSTPSTVLVMSLVLAALASITCWVVLGFALGQTRDTYIGFARGYACVLAFSSYVYINMLAMVQGNMRFGEFNTVRLLQTITYPAALIALWLSGAISVKTAAAAVVLGNVVLGLVLLTRHLGGHPARPAIAEALELGKRSIKLHVVNVVMQLPLQLEKMALVLWASNTGLGYYVVAYTAASTAPNVLVQTFINVMLPAAAKSSPRDASAYVPLRRVLTRIAALVVLVCAVMAVALPYLIPLVFGDGFQAAIPYALVLCAAAAASGIQTCLVYLLRSWQVTRPAFWGEAAASLLIAVGAYPTFRAGGVLALCWLLVVAQATGALVVWRGYSRVVA